MLGWGFLRHQDLLDVVPNGFPAHDDGELRGQLDQTAAGIALQGREKQPSTPGNGRKEEEKEQEGVAPLRYGTSP